MPLNLGVRHIKTMNVEELNSIISDSTLHTVCSLKEDIRANAITNIEFISHKMNVDSLLPTYQVRANHVKSLVGSHAKQLYLSTNELCENLKSYTGDNLYSVNVETSKEHDYWVVFDKSSLELVGCLKTISKLNVTESRWDEIWNH